MKIAAYLTIVATAIPTVWALPAGLMARQFTVPTCGAEACLASTNGTFVSPAASNGTAPGDFARICSLPQDEVSRYVQTVQPCLNGKEGKKACTPGAISQYKSILETECAKPAYGNKQVQWA
ncbi:hypothetical protein C7974DRAFT_439765 [Boeremia exigua]|uniref:uncharacterized protein n=1 Tax=Boeremia exigua TaxID=749465 RepID=UPI001E8CE5E6|nr:uncharacterized protein C7974DRAFT_439765 [Boeremia exigua]KAH6644434.1 hypothetical protein C7974DRAFT_439765 [Boeremia exigua]